MEPVVSVQTLLLKTQLPEVTLREGTSVVARVLSRGENHGVLVIAGIPLTATLPEAPTTFTIDGAESGTSSGGE